MFFKEITEISGIIKTQFIGNLLGRFIGIEQQALGFYQDSLLDDLDGCL